MSQREYDDAFIQSRSTMESNERRLEASEKHAPTFFILSGTIHGSQETSTHRGHFYSFLRAKQNKTNSIVRDACHRACALSKHGHPNGPYRGAPLEQISYPPPARATIKVLSKAEKPRAPGRVSTQLPVTLVGLGHYGFPP